MPAATSALSHCGARTAYLCGPPLLVDPLRAWTPPWAVSLPAQVAAVHALQEPEYYANRYRETHGLRRRLTEDLAGHVLDVVPGTAIERSLSVN